MEHKVNKYVKFVNVVLFTKTSIDNADTLSVPWTELDMRVPCGISIALW